MEQHCDVAIVGARCAGGALATFLARRGVSVVVVDKGRLPSEHVLSTHTVHPSGMAVMDELGLGDAVRRHSPEMRTVRFDWQGAQLDLEMARGHGEHCPRRKRFDGLLQDAAREAGAIVLERTVARGLVHTAGRVAGLELEGPDAQRTTLHARIVVGADGRHSRVASWVNAQEYLGYEAPRGMYWGYFRAPAGWGASAAYPAGMYIVRSGVQVRVAFHCDDDQLLLGTLPTDQDLPRFRADPLGALRAAIAIDPMLRDAVSQAPVEPVRGYLRERYFVRQAAGPGWLLLGDAALHKDFLSGDGMTEALVQARAASRAVVEALGSSEPSADRALERFWRARDVESIPLFFHAQDLGDPGSPAALNRAVFRGVASRPELRERFTSTFARAVSPYELLSPLTALRFAGLAALRGEPAALVQFLKRGQRVQHVMRELAKRRELLAALELDGPRNVA